MHILVTNDDGIESPGLWALAAALHNAKFGTITILAPMEENSGMSMSMPPRQQHEIRVVEPPDPAYAGITAFALNGTPAGCVSAAMLTDFCPKPDVVVSGINYGLNAGGNVMLSGTVGAAMIGAMWGLPAMAVSQQFVGDADLYWDTGAWAATRVFPLLNEFQPAEGVDPPVPLVLNVNVPHLPRDEIRGFRQTTLSEFFYGNFLLLGETEPNTSGGGHFRYRFDRTSIPESFPEASDDGAIRAGYVSVTPLAPMTVHPQIDLANALREVRG